MTAGGVSKSRGQSLLRGIECDDVTELTKQEDSISQSVAHTKAWIEQLREREKKG